MRSSDDDLFDDLERSLSCDGNQSDVRLQSQPLCYRFYAKNHKQLTNDPLDKTTDCLRAR